MSKRGTDLKQWMDARGISALEVAKALGTEEQTVRKWRSQGVPPRRISHVERYMSEWIDPSTAPRTEADTSTLRIEFSDDDLDIVSTAASIVDTPIREFIRRSAVHQARVEITKQSTAPLPSLKVAEGNESPRSSPANGAGGIKYPKGRKSS
jgi:transcriptional regulator with XRE-family HTH domain